MLHWPTASLLQGYWQLSDRDAPFLTAPSHNINITRSHPKYRLQQARETKWSQKGHSPVAVATFDTHKRHLGYFIVAHTLVLMGQNSESLGETHTKLLRVSGFAKTGSHSMTYFLENRKGKAFLIVALQQHGNSFRDFLLRVSTSVQNV